MDWSFLKNKFDYDLKLGFSEFIATTALIASIYSIVLSNEYKFPDQKSLTGEWICIDPPPSTRQVIPPDANEKDLIRLGPGRNLSVFNVTNIIAGSTYDPKLAGPKAPQIAYYVRSVGYLLVPSWQGYGVVSPDGRMIQWHRRPEEQPDVQTSTWVRE